MSAVVCACASGVKSGRDVRQVGPVDVGVGEAGAVVAKHLPGRGRGDRHVREVAERGRAAAAALGVLARERWKRATGEELPAPPPVEGSWPEGLDPSLEAVDVAISRTVPEHNGQAGIYEIEALYLAVIRATRRTLYIESQYFASRRIAEAIAERLAEPDGPEIVVINPATADGWLEEEVMGSSRARLLQIIQRADGYERFRLYTPVTAGGKPIYVHAKVLVSDARLLRVGSSNLNNRSLGFDTECDVSVESVPDAPDADHLRQFIIGLRNDLLAEHLGVPKKTVEREIERAGGSLVAAIEALRSEGRSLVPFVTPELNALEDAVLGENQLLDPERPSGGWRNFRRGLRRLIPGWAGMGTRK